MKIKHILTKPKEGSNNGIILIPGVSRNSLSNKYNFLAKELQKNNFYFLRFDIWKSPKDLEAKTLKQIYKNINEAIKYMKKIRCKKIILIGKSFGGGILLTKKFRHVDSLILLAPAINFSSKSNIKEIKNKKLSEIKSILDIKIDKKDLEKVNIKVLVIHGDKDKVVPIINSRKIIKNLKKGEIKIIKDANHSYESKENKLVDLIIVSLRKGMRHGA